MVRLRTSSPITHTTKDDGEVMILGPQKIHRIVLTHETICTISHVTSPSCIWLKLRNNIVEQQLQITREGGIGGDQNVWSGELTKFKEKPEVLHYVMAPHDKHVYSRARVLAYDSEYSDFAYVRFIDYGDCSWLHWSCLAEISHIMKCHPWQAIPVSLFKLFPTDFFMGEELPVWTEEDLNTLEEIVNNYSYFRVKPIFGSEKYNDYSLNIKVELFGLSAEDKFGGSDARKELKDAIALPEKRKEINHGDSISHLFKIQRMASIIKRKLFDAKEQPIFTLPNDEIPMCNPGDIEDFRLKFPLQALKERKKPGLAENGEPSAFGKTLEEFDKLNTNGEDIYPKVQLINLYNIRTEYSDGQGQYCIFVNYNSTVSPYEFYAYPLRKKQIEQEPGKEINELIEDRIKLSEELDTWYGQQPNRHPIDTVTVRSMLKSKIPVFGIYEVYSEHSETGSWRRVEIVSLRPNERDSGQMMAQWLFCRIRYVDFGGTDIVPLVNIIQIHKSHCEKPAMCMPLCMHTIKPIESEHWPEESNAYFRYVLRGDVPIFCELEENLNDYNPTEKEIMDDIIDAQNRRGVIFAKELKIMTNLNEPSLEDKLVNGYKNGQIIAKYK